MRDLSPPADRVSDHTATISLFGVMWAGAALWHLFGNPYQGEPWTEALLVLAAGAVLWRPGDRRALAALAVAGLVAMWEEMPVTGNHWVLVGFVDLALLVALGVGAWRGRRSDDSDLVRRFVPVARLCLLVAYAFAAFSKLNTSFLDPEVSCATFYFDQTTDSIGLSALQLDGARWVSYAVIFGTIAVELSVPVLLALRRTRHVGVLVALVFHGLLALDRTNHVYDFSSMLFPLFVLFLPPTTGGWVRERVGSVRARLALAGDSVPRLTHLLLVAIPTALGLLVATDGVDGATAIDLAWFPWQVYAALCIAAAVVYLRQRPPTAPRGALRPHHAAYLAVPLLVVLNGLTPYLELKSSYGWNMYSNLQTVGGESNHIIVRRTLPLSSIQDDLVRIVSTDDPTLALYDDLDYDLTWQQLRIYLSEHPDASLVYQRGAARVSLAPASSNPELVARQPGWREKLQPFRPVDRREAVRCRPPFGPAR